MPAEKNNSLLIAGSGAMACLFASRLCAAGANVTLLGAWPEGLQAIRRQGVRLVGPDGCEKSYPVQVIDVSGESLAACESTTTCGSMAAGVRFALVLVKSWQTRRAAHDLAGRLAPDGLALSLQNGLGNREQLVEALGAQRVALGVTTVGATLLAPGRVRQAGEGAIMFRNTAGLAQLAGWLRKAGFVVKDVQDTESLLWGKLVINAAINPLTALLDVPNGELLNRASARALMAAAAQEAAAVAQARGVYLPYPDPIAQVEVVARDTAGNYSSMLQDIRRGAPTEIDVICGAIVRAGEQLGVPTPINYTFWQLVEAKQARKQ